MAENEINASRSVYIAVYALGTASILCIASLGEQLAYTGTLYSVDMIRSLIDMDLTNIEKPLAISIVILDSFSTITLFDPNTVATRWSKNLPNGFWQGMKDHLKNMYFSPLRIGVPTLASFLCFPIGSYSCVEGFKEPLAIHFGRWKWGIIIPLLSIISSYYLFSQYKDNMDGIEYIIHDKNHQLHPPQERWIKRLMTQRHLANYATIFQIILELSAAIIVRGITYSFLAGRMAALMGLSGLAKVISEVAGFMLHLIALGPSRVPVTFIKYIGAEKNRLDLVTEAERSKMYHEKYDSLSMSVFILYELKRLYFSPLGVSEGLLAGYFMYYLAQTQGMADMFAIPIGVIVGVFSYLIGYRQANLMLELNTLALIDETIKQRVMTTINEARIANDLSPLVHSETPEMDTSNNGEFAYWLSVLFSFGKSIGIILSNFCFIFILLKNYVPKEPLAVFSITSNVIVSDNNFRFLQSKSAETIQAVEKRAVTFVTPGLSKMSSCFFSAKHKVTQLCLGGRDINERQTAVPICP